MRVRITLGERSYLVVRSREAGPVVMMLHGAGGTAAWTLHETRWAEYVDRGFVLVMPEATRPDPASPPGFLANPQVWNDGAADGQPPRPEVDDVAFLDMVLDHIGADRVFLTGFSNGAAMAFRYASERAERVAAIAPVAGYCNVEPRPSRPLPTLYLVGREDPLVPLEGGEIVTPWGRSRLVRRPVRDTLTRWAAAIGCSTESRTIESVNGDTIEKYTGPVPMMAYTIDGLGHHWPGGRGELLRRIAGPPSDRLDAREMIWEFFRSSLPWP